MGHACERTAGVSGIHAQTLSINKPIAKLNEAMGFRLVARCDLHAYEHLDGGPIQIHTWVLAM